MKLVYLEHISSSEDAFHDPGFALSRPSTQTKVRECNTCLAPFQIIYNIERGIGVERPDNSAVLTSIRQKFMLYMAHQHCCSNQEKRIAILFDSIRKDPSGKEVLILLDYKMNFEAIRLWEKTTECFGKKGMSWHGSVVFYRAKDTQGRLRANGELSTLFFDHILSNDMKQDRVALCSILDAILARLRIELPYVKNFGLLSDNARCYQNDLVTVSAPFIGKHHTLTIKSFIHSETQRGKSLVDAHFALAMMHITRYCNETRNDVTTPGDVVEGIHSFDGGANYTGDMLHLKRKL